MLVLLYLCFDIEELSLALNKINNNNAQGEYYLPDVIKIMNEKGLKTGAVIIDDNTEILGVLLIKLLLCLFFLLKAEVLVLLYLLYLKVLLGMHI